MVDGHPPPAAVIEALGRFPDPESENGPLQSREQLFEIFCEERCTCVLWHLYQSPDSYAEFDRLVDVIATWERMTNDDAPADLEDDVALTLHHFHLPKLIEAGLLDYDRRSETVAYVGDPVLETCFDRMSDEQ